MIEEPPRYQTYLLRYWIAPRQESPGLRPSPTWHFTLENPQTGERHQFLTLAALRAFLAGQIATDMKRET